MTIDSSTGLITMQTTELSLRGSYNLQVQVDLLGLGFIDNQSETNLSVEILSCDDLTLTLPSVTPFATVTQTYATFDPALLVNLPSEADLATLNGPLDCGPLKFDWDQTFSAT